MKIALASPPICPDGTQRLKWLDHLAEGAKTSGAVVVCFPESYLPGYPGMGYPTGDRTPRALEKALAEAQGIAARHGIAIIASDGTCLVHQRYGEPGITLCDIHPEKATGFLAKRFKPIDDPLN